MKKEHAQSSVVEKREGNCQRIVFRNQQIQFNFQFRTTLLVNMHLHNTS